MNITLEQLQAHEAEAERLNDEIEKLACEWADIIGYDIDGRAVYEGWNLWKDHITVTFRHSWQGDYDEYTVKLPTSAISDHATFVAAADAHRKEQEEAIAKLTEAFEAEERRQRKAQYEKLREEFGDAD